MSDRVIVMESGRIMQVGEPKDLYRRPVNRFVADFVGRASFIDVKRSPDGHGWAMPDGTPVRLDASGLTSEGYHQAMLRPEAIHLTGPDGQAGHAPEVNRLSGRVEEAHYMGAYTEYVVRAGGAVLKVHSALDFLPGAEVLVSFAPADCHLVAVPETSAKAA